MAKVMVFIGADGMCPEVEWLSRDGVVTVRDLQHKPVVEHPAFTKHNTLHKTSQFKFKELRNE